MGRTSYTTLKERAEPAAGVAVAEAPDDEVEISMDEQRRLAAQIRQNEIARLAQEAQEAKAIHAERGEVFIARAIDPHAGRLMSITSSWEPVTPSLCTEQGQYGGGCGWDAAKARGFKGGWDSIPENMTFDGKPVREIVLKDLEQHKALRHVTSGPAHIRTPEQIRKAREQRQVPDTFIENPRLG